MNAKLVPLPAPDDLATDRLAAAAESVIGGMQERLSNLAAGAQDAKWSVSGGDAKASRAIGAGLLQLRNQRQAERPGTISARWVAQTMRDDPRDQPQPTNYRN